MDLRRSGRKVGGKKSASTPGPSKPVPGISVSAADADVVIAAPPQPPLMPPSAPSIPAPAPQPFLMQQAQSSTPLAYRGLNMQVMWFQSTDQARCHTVTVWKPNCSEQDVPISDDEKEPFVQFLRNCMLDFTDVQDNANTSNPVRDGHFPKHFYEAAAVRVVDAAATLHLLGKQNKGAADPTLTRSHHVSSAHRDMRFRPRIETIGLLFKTEKKIVWDVIKGEKDLEYLCVMAPEARIKAVKKDRDNNEGRPRVSKGSKKRRRFEPEDDKAGIDDEGGEELEARLHQQETHAVAHDLTGQPIPASASVPHNAFSAPTLSFQGASSAHHGGVAFSPNFFRADSTEANTPHSIPVWTSQDSTTASPYALPASVPASPRFDAGRPTSSRFDNPWASRNDQPPAICSNSMAIPFYNAGDQGALSNERDNGYFSRANTPSNDAFNHPSSFPFDDPQQSSSTQTFGYHAQRSANNNISGNVQQNNNALMQDPAFLRGYFPQRHQDPSSFSPHPLQRLYVPEQGHEVAHADTSAPFSGHTINTQHQSASPIIDPDLMAESSHGHIGISPAKRQYEQSSSRIQATQETNGGGNGEASQVFEQLMSWPPE